jgi:hypothetical protein
MRTVLGHLTGMSADDKQKHVPTQPDSNLAAETRPIPSQAEGDEETIDADLNRKDKPSETKSPGKG